MFLSDGDVYKIPQPDAELPAVPHSIFFITHHLRR